MECGAILSKGKEEEAWNKRRQDRADRNITYDGGNAIFISVHCWCLRNSQTQLDEARWRDNLQVLADCLHGTNEDRLKTPSTGPHQTFAAKPNIRLPDVNEIPITYVDIDESLRFSDYIPEVQSWFDQNAQHSLVPKQINIVSVPVQRGSNILGIAQIGNNLCVIDERVIGGPNHLGEQGGYNTGKTLVHEIGHCLDQRHIFGNCDPTYNHADITPQRLANINAKVEKDENGDWVGSGDNRYRDCEIQLYQNTTPGLFLKGQQLPYSCFDQDNLLVLCNTESFEHFFNFMDYVRDQHMFMWSRIQALDMRAFIKTSGRLDYTVSPEPDPEASSNLVFTDESGFTTGVTTSLQTEDYFAISMGAVALGLIVAIIWISLLIK